jgi:hypothetical protein
MKRFELWVLKYVLQLVAFVHIYIYIYIYTRVCERERETYRICLFV